MNVMTLAATDEEEWTPSSLLQAPDPDYLLFRRRGHRKVLLGMAVIAVISVLGYLLFPPVFAPDLKLPPIIIATVATLVATGIYYLTSRSTYYPRHEFVDVVPALLLFISQLFVNRTFFPYAQSFGTSEVAIVAANAAVFAGVTAILIVGSFRSFLIILLVQVVIGSAFAVHYASNIWHFTQMAPMATMVAVAIYVNFSSEIMARLSFSHMQEVAVQREKIEDMLYNVLPRTAVDRIKRGEVVADSYSEVSVIFCDLVGFSALSKRVGLKHLLKILEDFFDVADQCAAATGVEKVKTIGDAYLAVCGGAIESQNCANSAIEFSKMLIDRLKQFNADSDFDLSVRIGIHTGSVVGGVIGSSKKVYDYWGDTMNVASRIQTVAEPDEILVSESTFHRARAVYRFDMPESYNLKNIGDVPTYRVL
jgi:adenylate cyclase